MRSPTPEYKKLKSVLKGTNSLLSRVPATENKTKLHHLKVQSFILLTHAAFEQYLEGVSRLVLEISIEELNKKGIVNPCIFALLVAETTAQLDDKIARKKIRLDASTNTKEFLNQAKKNHESVISSNNGITKKDQEKILTPIGINPESVDIVLSNSLDAFGTKRGGFAHNLKMQTEETKSSVLSEVNVICEGLKSFDEEACRILRTSIVL